MRVAGLLLAAGAGTRFGGPKALAEFGGRLLVEHGIELLRTAGAEPVHVVLGAQATRIVATVELSGARAVVNPQWADGMASSLRSGLDSMPEDVDAVLVTLVDQPLIGAGMLAQLCAAYEHGARLAAACYEGVTRNPVLIDRSLWSAVTAHAHGDTGARGYLRQHPEHVTPVPGTSSSTPADIDTPEDLAALERTHTENDPGALG